VIGKELRQWWRDPWRKLEWRSGIYTGLVIGVFASVSGRFELVAPLSGLVIAFMICLSGCNLYGQDGSAVWQTVVGQRRGTVAADVRGRQLAMIILFTPPAVIVSAVVIMVTGEHWAWPAVAAGVPALIGVASGLALVMSAVAVSPGVDPRRRVGPNDAGGSLVLQANISIWLCMMLATPTAAALALGNTMFRPWGPWAAIMVGVLNGGLAYWLLGKITIGYLTDRLPTLFTRIRYGRNDDGTTTGLLGALESSAQKAEEEARVAKEKAKSDRARKRLERV
jgi:ABC-2 type transport system permease protein